MNNTRAKGFRRKVYGAGMPRDHKYARDMNGTITITSDRRKYKDMKKAYKWSQQSQ